MAKQTIETGKTFAERDPKINANFDELYEIANAGDSGLREFLDPINEGDDKGITCTGGQFSVGTKDDPRETCLGGGDSTPVDTAYHCDIATTTALTITGATDVTTILQSDNNSSVSFFGGDTAGKYLLIGEEYPFGGAKLKWNTLGDIEYDNITIEYLRDSSPTWIPAPFMATNANLPYSQYADRIGSEDVEQLFVGFDPDDLPTTWAKTTLSVNGTDITKYWARVRIVSDITLSPIIEQVKTHSNCLEIENDGNYSYRGRARRPITLQSGLVNTRSNVLATPANENIKYTSDIVVEGKFNKFANNKVDGFILTQNIIEGLDTSIPLSLSVSWYVDGSATGDVNLHLDLVDVSNGFPYDGTGIATSIENSIETISSSSNGIRKTTTIKFLVNKLDTESGVVIYLHRDATVANTSDTLQEDIVITHVVLSGYAWK